MKRDQQRHNFHLPKCLYQENALFKTSSGRFDDSYTEESQHMVTLHFIYV